MAWFFSWLARVSLWFSGYFGLELWELLLLLFIVFIAVLIIKAAAKILVELFINGLKERQKDKIKRKKEKKKALFYHSKKHFFKIVRKNFNIEISGAQGSGKTTLMLAIAHALGASMFKLIKKKAIFYHVMFNQFLQTVKAYIEQGINPFLHANIEAVHKELQLKQRDGLKALTKEQTLVQGAVVAIDEGSLELGMEKRFEKFEGLNKDIAEKARFMRQDGNNYFLFTNQTKGRMWSKIRDAGYLPIEVASTEWKATAAAKIKYAYKTVIYFGKHYIKGRLAFEKLGGLEAIEADTMQQMKKQEALLEVAANIKRQLNSKIKAQKVILEGVEQQIKCYEELLKEQKRSLRKASGKTNKNKREAIRQDMEALEQQKAVHVLELEAQQQKLEKLEDLKERELKAQEGKQQAFAKKFINAVKQQNFELVQFYSKRAAAKAELKNFGTGCTIICSISNKNFKLKFKPNQLYMFNSTWHKEKYLKAAKAKTA